MRPRVLVPIGAAFLGAVIGRRAGGDLSPNPGAFGSRLRVDRFSLPASSTQSRALGGASRSIKSKSPDELSGPSSQAGHDISSAWRVSKIVLVSQSSLTAGRGQHG